MTRGFVTLATGNIKYYNMALNMLRAFRIHNPGVPFAIVCDRHNEVTEQFDDVVILENANGDYRDKFSLLINSPYDENIFIEPDCLIYRNLDFFWDLLSKESDFSCFGWNNGGLSRWFKTEETLLKIKELFPKLVDCGSDPLFTPGYLFIRKGEKCKKMYDDCILVAEGILSDNLLSKYGSMICNGKLRDDPVLTVAMAMSNFICSAKPKEGKCISLPSKYKINKIDILNGYLDVTAQNGKMQNNCALLHFSTRRAEEEGLYLWQVTVVDWFIRNKSIAKILNTRIFYIPFFVFRKVKKRIKSLLMKSA